MTALLKSNKQVNTNHLINKTVMYRCYTGSDYGYAYLTGRVDAIETNGYGQTVAKVYNYALKRHQRVLASLVITEGALVEIKYHGEMIAVEVLQVDYRVFEAQDAFGESKWVMPTRITGVIATEWTYSQVTAQELIA